MGMEQRRAMKFRTEVMLLLTAMLLVGESVCVCVNDVKGEREREREREIDRWDCDDNMIWTYGNGGGPGGR